MTLGVGNDKVAGPHGISLNTQGFSCLTIAVSEVAGPHGIGLNTRGFSCMRIVFKMDALVETRKHTGRRWICVRCAAGWLSAEDVKDNRLTHLDPCHVARSDGPTSGYEYMSSNLIDDWRSIPPEMSEVFWPP
jgi:hypothetical protein